MPRLTANLTMMYAEHFFLDRFQAAAGTGSRASNSCSPMNSPPPT